MNSIYTNSGSYVRVKVDITIPFIVVTSGYIIFTIPTTNIQPAPSPLGDYCIPGKMLTRSANNPLECYRNSGGSTYRL